MNKIVTLDALEHFKSKIIAETQHNYDDYATALKTLQDNVNALKEELAELKKQMTETTDSNS